VKTKKPMTFEQHKELGEHIRFLNAQASHILCLLSNYYPISHPVVKGARKLNGVFMQWKSDLDSQAFRDCPDIAASHEGAQSLMKIYYGHASTTDTQLPMNGTK
jgi:hypothetical protein